MSTNLDILDLVLTESWEFESEAFQILGDRWTKRDRTGSLSKQLAKVVKLEGLTYLQAEQLRNLSTEAGWVGL